MKKIVLAAVMLAGCGADAPVPARPAAPAQFDTTALGAHSLVANSLPQMRLLATQGGRDVMARVVSCALPRGASLTAINSAGTPYSFAGGTGLAPDWASRPATASERVRVTDCVLGRAPTPTAPRAPRPVAPAAINRV